MSGYYRSILNVLAPAFDADAQAFITAASITDPTQQSAVNQLVVDLKAASIWTKMTRIYPMVGGSATSHRVDLKTLASGTFFGGWTHASTGALPNGTTGYFDTGLNTNALTNNSTHLSYYSRTNTLGASNTDMGATGTAGNAYLPLISMNCRDGANVMYNRAYGYATTEDFNVANSAGTKFFVANRTSSTVANSWRDGSKLGTTTYTNTRDITTVSKNVFIGALNLDGAAGQFGIRECAFSSIGDGLSDADVAAFTTAVDTFETTLSRNI